MSDLISFGAFRKNIWKHADIRAIQLLRKFNESFGFIHVFISFRALCMVHLSRRSEINNFYLFIFNTFTRGLYIFLAAEFGAFQKIQLPLYSAYLNSVVIVTHCKIQDGSERPVGTT